MIKQLFKGLARAKQLKDERGAALVEIAFVLPMILVLIFGLIDFSQIILDNLKMSGMSRQGSDLVAKGVSAADTLTALDIQGGSLNIGTQGMIILTQVQNNKSNQPTIFAQTAAPTGISVASKVGTGVGNPAFVPSSATSATGVLAAGQTLFVTEVFYSYKPITPLGGFFKANLASNLYEVAYF
jgi:Flp pilus assembly protein TadG